MNVEWTIRTRAVEVYDGIPFAVEDGLYIYSEVEFSGGGITRTLYGPITNELMTQFEYEFPSLKPATFASASQAHRIDGQEE
jgi:hypothetical protein